MAKKTCTLLLVLIMALKNDLKKIQQICFLAHCVSFSPGHPTPHKSGRGKADGQINICINACPIMNVVLTLIALLHLNWHLLRMIQ